MDNTREKLIKLLRDGVRCPGVIDSCVDCPNYTVQHDCDEFGATVDMLIANGVTVQEWISVKDSLPDKDDRYATVCDFGNGFVSRGVLGFAKDFSKLVTYQTTAKNVWYEYDREYGFVMITYVTHWMPLPQPPKGE